MRTPREDETEQNDGCIGATTVTATVDPGVWATVIPLGKVTIMTVHVDQGGDDGEHIAETAIYGRGNDGVTFEDALIRARRAVVEQADYRAEHNGRLVRETIPREVATAGGLHSWVAIGSDEAARRHQVAQDWADERVEETGARFADVRFIGGEARVSLHYDTPRATTEDWAALDNGSGEVARAFAFTDQPTER